MSKPSQYDTLSGLSDRAQLWSSLHQTLQQIRRSNSNAGVLLIELNDIADVEGIVGKHGAEEYITAMAKRILKCIWDTDVAVRFDHHQFVIIANSIQKQDDIHIVLNKIRNYLALDHEIDGKKIEPSIAIGIVLLPADALEIDAVITNAQTALQLAKSGGENSYCYFNQDLGDRIIEQEKIKNAILATLAEESFVLLLQPKISTESGEICGAEALVRMRDNDGNIVVPGDFIPVAENSNLIMKIGDWVLNKAQMLSDQFIKQGFNIPISVNISDIQLKNSASLISTLHQLQEKNSEGICNLILEISENIIASNVELAVPIMAEVRELGYQISIDGFGSGFSSLSVLRDLQIDELKIDRNFMNDVPYDTKNTAILQSIIMLGKAMNFRVVVMGVETDEQVQLLEKYKCDEFQGFIVSEPLDEKDFLEWCKNYSA